MLAKAMFLASALVVPVSAQPIECELVREWPASSLIMPSHFQLEGSISYVRYQPPTFEESIYQARWTESARVTTGLARIGLEPWLELRLGIRYAVESTTLAREFPQPADMVEMIPGLLAGAKVMIIEDTRSAVGLAFICEVAAPVTAAGLFPMPSMRIAASSRVARTLSLGGGIGVEWRYRAGHEERALPYLLGVMFELDSSAIVGADVAGDFTAIRYSHPYLDEPFSRHSLAVSGAWRPVASLRFDCRLGLALGDDFGDWSAAAGIALRLPD
jgi:hypothetical protein